MKQYAIEHPLGAILQATSNLNEAIRYANTCAKRYGVDITVTLNGEVVYETWLSICED